MLNIIQNSTDLELLQYGYIQIVNRILHEKSKEELSSFCSLIISSYGTKIKQCQTPIYQKFTMMDNSTETCFFPRLRYKKKTQSLEQRNDNEESVIRETTAPLLWAQSGVFSFSRALPVRCATGRWVAVGLPACHSNGGARFHLNYIPGRHVRSVPRFLFCRNPPL